jgi:hypothetical protein
VKKGEFNMKNLVGPATTILGWLLLASITYPARGSLFLSNLGEQSLGVTAVGNDLWIGQPFNTGNNPGGWLIESVDLLMGDSEGQPDGFSITINGPSRFGPGPVLATLGGPEPISAGVYNYTGTGVVLPRLTTRWLVLTSETGMSEGSYSWGVSETLSYESSSGWTPGPYYDSSSDGLQWMRNTGSMLQFAIHGAPIPESTILALVGMSGLFVLARAVKRRLVGGGG